MASEDAYDATKLESERNSYDMIIVGADENQEAQLAWIKRQNCYVMVIHGKKKTANGKSNENEGIELPRMSVEKV